MIMTTNKRPHRHEINWLIDKKDSLREDKKKNLHHNSTAQKEGYKKQRDLLRDEYENEYEYYLWCLNFPDDIDY